MYKSLLLFFLLIYFSFTTSQAQNFKKANVSIVFPGSNNLNINSQIYDVSYYKGEPKGIELGDAELFYYNPGRYCQYYQIEDQNERINYGKKFTFVRFYLNYSTDKVLTVDKEIIDHIQKGGNHLKEEIVSETQVKSTSLNQEYVHTFFRPFYFKKWEVTNTEYREFLHYVRDSIAHRILGHVNDKDEIQWNASIDWKNEKVSEFYLYSSGYHYYGEGLIKYAYINSDGKRRVIDVVPNLDWNTSFPYAYNEPKSRSYFHSSIYDQYPVVGVSYHQAEAFCNWKTQQLNKENKKYKITVQVPSEVEWEWIATDFSTEKKLHYSKHLLDESWITDLKLSADYSNNSRPEDELKKLNGRDRFYIRSPYEDGGESFAHIANPPQKRPTFFKNNNIT